MAGYRGTQIPSFKLIMTGNDTIVRVVTLWWTLLLQVLAGSVCVSEGTEVVWGKVSQRGSPWVGFCSSGTHFILFFKFIYFLEGTLFLFILFIYVWLHWVLVAMCGLSLVTMSGGYSLLQCAGFSLWWLLLLQSTGSRHVGFSSCGTQALEHRLSSCGARA